MLYEELPGRANSERNMLECINYHLVRWAVVLVLIHDHASLRYPSLLPVVRQSFRLHRNWPGSVDWLTGPGSWPARLHRCTLPGGGHRRSGCLESAHRHRPGLDWAIVGACAHPSRPDRPQHLDSLRSRPPACRLSSMPTATTKAMRRQASIAWSTTAPVSCFTVTTSSIRSSIPYTTSAF